MRKITHLAFAICKNQNANLLKYLFEWKSVNRKASESKSMERKNKGKRLILLNRCFERKYNYASLRNKIQNGCKAWIRVVHKWLCLLLQLLLFLILFVARFVCIFVRENSICSIPCGSACILYVDFYTSPIPGPHGSSLKLALNWSGCSHCGCFCYKPVSVFIERF